MPGLPDLFLPHPPRARPSSPVLPRRSCALPCNPSRACPLLPGRSRPCRQKPFHPVAARPHRASSALASAHRVGQPIPRCSSSPHSAPIPVGHAAPCRLDPNRSTPVLAWLVVSARTATHRVFPSLHCQIYPRLVSPRRPLAASASSFYSVPMHHVPRPASSFQVCQGSPLLSLRLLAHPIPACHAAPGFSNAPQGSPVQVGHSSAFLVVPTHVCPSLPSRFSPCPSGPCLLAPSPDCLPVGLQRFPRLPLSVAPLPFDPNPARQILA